MEEFTIGNTAPQYLSLTSHDTFTLSDNHVKGKFGEKQSVKAIKRLGAEVTYTNIYDTEDIELNDRLYCTNSCKYLNGKKVSGKSVDLKFKFKNNRFIAEVKNVNVNTRLGYGWLKRHVVDRFISVDPLHKSNWLLIISKLNCSSHVRALLRQYGVYILEVGLFNQISIIKQLIPLLQMLCVDNLILNVNLLDVTDISCYDDCYDREYVVNVNVNQYCSFNDGKTCSKWSDFRDDSGIVYNSYYNVGAG